MVNIEKTNACTIPTIISKAKNGRGTTKAKIAENRSDHNLSGINVAEQPERQRDRLVKTEIISRIPTKRLIGLKEKYLFR